MHHRLSGFFLRLAGLLACVAACNGQTTDTPGDRATGTGDQGGAGGGGGVGGAGSGGVAGSGAGAPGVCDNYVGLASLSDIAKSPFADEEAELLAIEASSTIVAPAEVFERVLSDLKLLRAQNPQLQGIRATTSWPSNTLQISFDEVGAKALAAGTYSDWNCTNAWYGAHEPAITMNYALMTFDHLYHLDLLGQQYKVLPHVTGTFPLFLKGNGAVGDERKDICVSLDQETYRYVFASGSGDCVAGCIDETYWGFSTSGSPPTVTSLGTFSNPGTPPAWFTALPDCTKWL